MDTLIDSSLGSRTFITNGTRKALIEHSFHFGASTPEGAVTIISVASYPRRCGRVVKRAAGSSVLWTGIV